MICMMSDFEVHSANLAQSNHVIMTTDEKMIK